MIYISNFMLYRKHCSPGFIGVSPIQLKHPKHRISGHLPIMHINYTYMGPWLWTCGLPECQHPRDLASDDNSVSTIYYIMWWCRILTSWRVWDGNRTPYRLSQKCRKKFKIALLKIIWSPDNLLLYHVLWYFVIEF